MEQNQMDIMDVPVLPEAELFVTINGNRYSMLMAKNFKATANITTKEVKLLRKRISGRKPVGMYVKVSMTLYKCTEVFDDVVETYKNTGVLPPIEAQVSSEDETTSIGRSTKIYTGITLDGDVLLSAFDSEGEFIEQTIEGYASDYTSPEKYTNPSYM